MKQVTISYPESLATLLKLTDRELADELRFLAAAKLYELGRLSGSQAAHMIGATRLDFLRRLDRIGVAAINLRDEEVELEIRAAHEIAG